MRFILRTAAVCLLGSGAQAGLPEDMATLFETGRSGAAVELAQNAVEQNPTPEAHFALGTALFVVAVEHLGQGLFDFGLGNAAVNYDIAGSLDLPFLRLPIPPNPNPQPVTYNGLRDILVRFEADLAMVDMALAPIGPEPFDFPLDLDRIALDFTGDAAPDDAVALLDVFLAVTSTDPPAAGLAFDFDQSDAVWLRGYTHLLRAMSGFLLAYDWHQMFEDTFHSVFFDADLPSAPLRRAAQEALDFIKAHPKPPDYHVFYRYNDPKMPDLGAWLRDTPEGQAYAAWDETYGDDYRRADNLLYNGYIADLIAGIHRFDWPVSDPARLGAVRGHLLQTVMLSRENWRRILAETDDKREWLPSPAQTPRFRRMRVSRRVVDGWHGVLDTAEDLLEGRRLIAHWRFPHQGVNLRRFFEEPRTFDPVMIAQGTAVIPYLENGETVSSRDANALLDVFGRGFMAYFLWFN